LQLPITGMDYATYSRYQDLYQTVAAVRNRTLVVLLTKFKNM